MCTFFLSRRPVGRRDNQWKTVTKQRAAAAALAATGVPLSPRSCIARLHNTATTTAAVVVGDTGSCSGRVAATPAAAAATATVTARDSRKPPTAVAAATSRVARINAEATRYRNHRETIRRTGDAGGVGTARASGRRLSRARHVAAAAMIYNIILSAVLSSVPRRRTNGGARVYRPDGRLEGLPDLFTDICGTTAVAVSGGGGGLWLSMYLGSNLDG